MKSLSNRYPITGRLLVLGLLVASMFVLFRPVQGLAQDEVQIKGDHMQSEGGVYSVEGDVVITRGEAVLKADSVLYHRDSGDVLAEGDVRYDDPDVNITARKAELNIHSKLGTLYDAFLLIKEDEYRLTGEEIEKTGDKAFVLRRASATTCRGEEPDWCFRGSRVKVLLGESLRATNATFRVKGVPVFYSPYLWFPIITSRQSGLLFPTFGYQDSRGFFYRQPYFWAISDNRDATFYVDYYSREALGEGVEYRYVEGPATKGSANIYHLRDAVKDTDYYELRAGHVQETGAVRAFYDLNYINEKDFYRLYEPYIEQKSKRFLESNAEISVGKSGDRVYVLGRYLRELKESADQKTVLQKGPEVGFFKKPIGLGPLLFRLNASTTEFERQEGHDGHRTDLNAEGSYLLGSAPAFLQTIGTRQSFYEIRTPGDSDGLRNGTFLYKASLAGILERDFGSFTHSFEPALSYEYLTVDGEAPVIFDSTELETDASLVRVELLNRFLDGSGEFFTLKAVQPYDLDGGASGFLPLEVDLLLRRPVILRSSFKYDHTEEEFQTINSTLTFGLYSASVTAGHNFNNRLDVSAYKLDIRRSFGRLGVKAGMKYDEGADEPLEEVSAEINYQSQCWGADLSFIRHPDDYLVFINVNLLGIGELKFR